MPWPIESSSSLVSASSCNRSQIVRKCPRNPICLRRLLSIEGLSVQLASQTSPSSMWRSLIAVAVWYRCMSVIVSSRNCVTKTVQVALVSTSACLAAGCASALQLSLMISFYFLAKYKNPAKRRNAGRCMLFFSFASRVCSILNIINYISVCIGVSLPASCSSF